MASNLAKARERVSVQPTVHTCRMWIDACAAFEDVREMCSNADLLSKAAYLERMSAALWRRGDRSCCVAAIQAMQIARLLVTHGKPSAMSRTVLESELDGAALDVGDALGTAGRPLSDPMVQQVDALTEMLWSRGDDKHARAAVHMQRIAVTLIQNGVRV